MDTLKDILSDKVNAQSIIRANEEAAKRDELRKDQRIAEYEKLVEDLKRLQFKSAEVNEQTSQLIASAIEKIEGYAFTPAVDVSKDIEPAVELIRAQGEIQGINGARLSEVSDRVSELSAKLDSLLAKDEGAENRKHIEEHVHRENVRVYRNVQAVVENQTSGRANEIKDEIGSLKKQLKSVTAISVITLIAALAAAALAVMSFLG